MVAHNEAVSMNATASVTYTIRSTGNSKTESFRWRSRGWTPLAYPASALIGSNDTGKPFFPLQRDVLRAAIREMLILDGSMDCKTLKVKDERLKNGKIVNHIRPCVNDTGKETEFCHKRKLPTSPATVNATMNKRRKNGDGFEVVKENEISITNAEILVDLILDRACLTIDDPRIIEPALTPGDGIKDTFVSLDDHDRRPRKVSDLDQVSIVDQLDVEENYGENDISLFLDLANRKADGSLRVLKQKLPPFLDVSIAVENSLRNAAYRMVTQTCLSFDDEPIHLFLGYKSCALKRQRLVRVLSDYLFDVSHAMFAWKQTEDEILSERVVVPSRFDQELDTLVRDSLFDDRALKKIGGFDDSSILRHAVQISRSERKKESWEQFAKTKNGRRLLSHHRAGRAHLVGQKRRGQRIKRFSSSASIDTLISDEGQRSRASSIGSCEEAETQRSFTVATEMVQTHQATTSTGVSVTSAQKFLEVLELTLIREIGQSWGVLLSREGDMCVVERSSESSSLRCGDLILSIKNNRHESASPPASLQTNTGIGNPDWFKEVVDVFKGSHELHLVVQRVGA